MSTATWWATTRGAPTRGDDANPVGAGLVPAPSTTAGDDANPVGAGLVPAPSTTAGDDANPVGAGLVPAPSTTAGDDANPVGAGLVPAPSVGRTLRRARGSIKPQSGYNILWYAQRKSNHSQAGASHRNAQHRGEAVGSRKRPARLDGRSRVQACRAGADLPEIHLRRFRGASRKTSV
jgi:hypothetical protein